MSSNIYDKEQKKLIPFAGNSEATAGSLDGLTDVNISSPTDGQVLTYDATNDVWVNGEGATVIESLGDIADVDLTNLQDGQTIVWDATEEKWVPGTSGTSLTAGFGISIENDEIKTTDFVGTQAQWDALTDVQKAAYDFVHITDDASPENYSPGHAISDGTSEKTQREVLEFNGFDVTDDSVNGKTKIAEVPYTAGDGIEITNKEIAVGDEISRTWTGTTAEWNAIADTSAYDGWIINLTDDHAVGSYIEDAVTEGSLNAVTSGAVYNTFKVKKLSLTNKNTGAYGLVAIEGLSSVDNMLILRCEASKSDGTVGTVLAYPTYDKRYRTFYIRCVGWDDAPMLNVDMDIDVYYITVPL